MFGEVFPGAKLAQQFPRREIFLQELVVERVDPVAPFFENRRVRCQVEHLVEREVCFARIGERNLFELGAREIGALPACLPRVANSTQRVYRRGKCRRRVCAERASCGLAQQFTVE